AAAPNKTSKLYDLVDETQFDADTLYPVINGMESKGMIRVEREKYGNNIIRLIR
ncbi:MAG: hypothetical protein JOZ52_10010, partial [Acidobacteria bacterium]|nr:hypothetical protein [Acidobacteriota bacterium]